MEGYQQRPYNGPTVPRHAPQQYPPDTGLQQYVEHQDGYNDSDGFQDQYNGGHDPGGGYSGGYGDMSYRRGVSPPTGPGGYHHGYYGPLRARDGPHPMRGVHGGPPHVAGTSDDAKRGPSGSMRPSPGRGGYGAPPGRGSRPGQINRSGPFDPSGKFRSRCTTDD